MTAGCCYGGGTDGLISGHAYSLLDTYELTDAAGNVEHRLVKMRNPWAEESYHGAFSDEDPNWTDDWKAQVGLTVANDGVFWMPYETLSSYFMYVAVALYDDYQIVQENLVASENYYQILWHNPTDQYVYITGETFSERHYPRTDDCNPNNNVVLYLYNDATGEWLGNPDYAFVGWKGYGTIAASWTDKLPAGDYTLLVVNQGFQEGEKDLSLQWYSTDTEIELGEIY